MFNSLISINFQPICNACNRNCSRSCKIGNGYKVKNFLLQTSQLQTLQDNMDTKNSNKSHSVKSSLRLYGHKKLNKNSKTIWTQQAQQKLQESQKIQLNNINLTKSIQQKQFTKSYSIINFLTLLYLSSFIPILSVTRPPRPHY